MRESMNIFIHLKLGNQNGIQVLKILGGFILYVLDDFCDPWLSE